MNQGRLCVQELQGQMDIEVQKLNADISAGQNKLQVCREALPVNLTLVPATPVKSCAAESKGLHDICCRNSSHVALNHCVIGCAEHVQLLPHMIRSQVATSAYPCRPCSKVRGALQSTQQALQRTEGALEAAHMELDSIKSHIAEQDAAMEELQNELNQKESLLNTISMAACKSHPSWT